MSGSEEDDWFKSKLKAAKELVQESKKWRDNIPSTLRLC